MNDKPELSKPELSNDDRAYRDYVLMLTTARVAGQRDMNMLADRLLASAHLVYDTAPPSARPGLDAIKRIMEIDTRVTNPASVLWRASIRSIGETPWTPGTYDDHDDIQTTSRPASARSSRISRPASTRTASPSRRPRGASRTRCLGCQAA